MLTVLKPASVTDNGQYQILWKISFALASPTPRRIALDLLYLCYKIGTKPIDSTDIDWQEISSRLMPERFLRLVVERKPVPFLPNSNNPQYILVYVTEVLECGHTLDFYPQADALVAKRRQCPECAELNKKKPAQSAHFPIRKKEAI